jgi:hypothetical protein
MKARLSKVIPLFDDILLCNKIIGIADGSIMAAIITTHIEKTAIRLIADQAGDIGIVIITIG